MRVEGLWFKGLGFRAEGNVPDPSHSLTVTVQDSTADFAPNSKKCKTPNPKSVLPHVATALRTTSESPKPSRSHK